MTNILVLGGAGYIGSHTCISLLEAGYDVTVVDNFENSSPIALRHVQEITNKSIKIIEGDIRSPETMQDALKQSDPFAVIHFAGLKAVGESVSMPLRYYDYNVQGTLNVLKEMSRANVKNIVFSSSATVYGEPQKLPISEDHPLSATNPYGRTKLMVEQILMDLSKSDEDWRIVALRYFNPCGAHHSGLIGEDPKGVPNNLMPYIAQVASERLSHLQVWGDDYDTPDGTGVRDYIHVVDLAEGHVAAIDKILELEKFAAINLGTGRGYSVLEMLNAFSAASGKQLAHEIKERRPGDVASCFADPAHAQNVLNWSAKFGVQEMCRDHWKWQKANPNGFVD